MFIIFLIRVGPPVTGHLRDFASSLRSITWCKFFLDRKIEIRSANFSIILVFRLKLL